jgi:hypothetical protein
VEIVAALICDAATVREGLLNVLGAGITRLWRPQLPAPLSIDFATLISCPQEQIGRLHEVEVRITGPSGNAVAVAMGAFKMERAQRLEDGEAQLLPLVLSFQTVATKEFGRHCLAATIDHDGATTKELDFWVLHRDERKIPPL